MDTCWRRTDVLGTRVKTIRTGNGTVENNGRTNDRAIVCVNVVRGSAVCRSLVGCNTWRATAAGPGGGTARGAAGERPSGGHGAAGRLEFGPPWVPSAPVENRNSSQNFRPTLGPTRKLSRKSKIRGNRVKRKKKMFAVLPRVALLRPRWARTNSKFVVRPTFAIAVRA